MCEVQRTLHVFGIYLMLNFSSKLTVAIQYETKEPAESTVSAMQWLEPTQTTGKIHPYLFTQCQVIWFTFY